MDFQLVVMLPVACAAHTWQQQHSSNRHVNTLQYLDVVSFTSMHSL
jgi:hypothetical protein